VIVTDNMFGDIITDLGAMVQGGMGIGRRRQTSTRSGRRLDVRAYWWLGSEVYREKCHQSACLHLRGPDDAGAPRRDQRRGSDRQSRGQMTSERCRACRRERWDTRRRKSGIWWPRLCLIRSAPLVSPRCSSIIWPAQMQASELMTVFPVYFGAEPPIGSNIETPPGSGLIVAAGGNAHSALNHRAQVSDNVAEHVVVTITSNHSGFLTIHMQVASTCA